jgi:hypothetical protein
MIVCDVVEEMNFFLLQKETSGNRVDRSITPAFIKEPTILVKRFKIVKVRFRPKPVEISNFKIGPLGGYS